MMVIFVEQIYLNILPIQQVLSKNKLGQIIVLGPYLLRKLVNVKKSNALKKTMPCVFFQKLLKKIKLSKIRKHHIKRFSKTLGVMFFWFFET